MSTCRLRHWQRLMGSMVLVGIILGALPVALLARSNDITVAHRASPYQQDNVPATITALYEQLQAIDATKTAIAQAMPATHTPTAVAGRTPTRTPLPTPTPTQTRAPTPTATATPTRVIAVAQVLVPTLNMRAGPGTEFPVIARSQSGEIFPIVAQADACAWLQVVQENGDQAWISGSAAFTEMNVACDQVPAFVAARTVTLPQITATPPRPTATPRGGRQTQPSPTLTPTRGTPTPPPTNAPQIEAGGPTTVQIDAPAENANVADSATFAWIPDQPLAPGQVYELAFWRPGESWNDGRALSGASDKSTVELRVSNLGAGTYLWGIILGAFEPNGGAYQRLRFLGGNRTIVVSGGSSNNTNSGDNNPDDPDNPHAGGK